MKDAPADGLLVFAVAGQRYGIAVAALERVVKMVEVAPLPRGPVPVCGVIDVSGEIVPVFSVRRRFELRERPLLPDDYLLIARSGQRRVAVIAEEILEVVARAAERFSKGDFGVPADPIAGALHHPDGLILIQDLDAFLRLEEERQLEQALQERGSE